MTGAIIIGILIVLIVIDVPIGFALGLAGASGLVLIGLPNSVQLALATYSGVEIFPLVAVPLFLLMANLMEEAQITAALVDFGQVLVGRIQGALAIGTVATALFMGGVSGSSFADVVSVGSIMIPALERDGYPPAWASALVAASNMVGAIIPPSILMILYGLAANQSIIALFVAGIVPGVLISVAYGVRAYSVVGRRGFGRRGDAFSWRRLGSSLIKTTPALVIPVVILVGVLGGVFTVSESAGIGAAYAVLFLIGRAIWTRQSLRATTTALVRAFSKTFETTSIVAFLLGGSALLAQALVLSGLPDQLSAALVRLHLSQWELLFVLNLCMLLMGTVLEPAAAVLIVGSLFVPIAQRAHINLIYFGIVTVMNLQIGTLTPPVGGSGYITARLAGTPYESVVVELLPWIGWAVGLLLMVTYIPAITLWLPHLLRVG